MARWTFWTSRPSVRFAAAVARSLASPISPRLAERGFHLGSAAAAAVVALGAVIAWRYLPSRVTDRAEL